MSGLFPDRRFAGFGPSQFDPFRPRPPPCTSSWPGSRLPCGNDCGTSVHGGPASTAWSILAAALIYVGKAKCLRTRLLSYFRNGSRDPKAGRIIDHTRAIVWEHAATEFAALLRELELIRRWKPAYNVQGIPGYRRATYICLGRKPAPYLFAIRQPPADAVAVYGPLAGGRRVADAVRRLNDLFRLRDCEQTQKMHFADQGELFPVLRPPGCLRLEIGTCSGPCAGSVSRGSYGRQTRAARAFLDGSDYSVLRRLEQDMVVGRDGESLRAGRRSTGQA